MQKFIKKPMEVEAVQFDGTIESIDQIAKLTFDIYIGSLKLGRYRHYSLWERDYNPDYIITTVNGIEYSLRASDWVIKDENGNISFANWAHFKKNYELVSTD